MAAGLPIVCSDFKVWRELVADNGVGVTVNPENTEEVVSAIVKLAHDPELRKEMGERGQQLVKERYNWDCEAEKLVSVYHELLGKESGRP